MAVENLGTLLAHVIQFVDSNQLRGGEAWSHPFPQQLGKAEGKVSQRWIVELKNIQIEMEGFCGSETAAIEMRGANHEGPGPVRESTWASSRCRGFKQPGVGTVLSLLTGFGRGTVGAADELLECLTQSAANHVAGFTWRKVEGLIDAEA